MRPKKREEFEWEFVQKMTGGLSRSIKGKGEVFPGVDGRTAKASPVGRPLDGGQRKKEDGARGLRLSEAPDMGLADACQQEELDYPEPTGQSDGGVAFFGDADWF